MLQAKLARRLGVISSDMYSVVKSLSKIRNKCAHSEQQFQVFSDTEIREHTNNIFERFDPDLYSTEGKKTYSTKEKFKFICDYTDAYLSIALRDEVEPIVSPSKEAIFR